MKSEFIFHKKITSQNGEMLGYKQSGVKFFGTLTTQRHQANGLSNGFTGSTFSHGIITESTIYNNLDELLEIDDIIEFQNQKRKVVSIEKNWGKGPKRVSMKIGVI